MLSIQCHAKYDTSEHIKIHNASGAKASVWDQPLHLKMSLYSAANVISDVDGNI